MGVPLYILYEAGIIMAKIVNSSAYLDKTWSFILYNTFFIQEF
jgi:Sec-independent protein secretion pathway component TatC